MLDFAELMREVVAMGEVNPSSPVYVWVNPYGNLGSWAIDTDPGSLAEKPTFIYLRPQASLN